MTTNSWTRVQYLNLFRPDFWYLSNFLCHVTLNLEGPLSLVRPQKSFFHFNEIWCVDRGRWLMHDGMPYDLIQGQGHGASEVPKIALFKVYLFLHLQWQLANDHWFLNYSTMSKFDRAGFLLFVLLFVSHDLELGGVPVDSPSTKKFFRFQWNLIRWWVMHDGMPYDPIRGQGQGHECLKATQEELTVRPAWD